MVDLIEITPLILRHNWKQDWLNEIFFADVTHTLHPYALGHISSQNPWPPTIYQYKVIWKLGNFFNYRSNRYFLRNYFEEVSQPLINFPAKDGKTFWLVQSVLEELSEFFLPKNGLG